RLSHLVPLQQFPERLDVRADPLRADRGDRDQHGALCVGAQADRAAGRTMSAGATAPRSAWEHAGEVAALIAILLALWQLMHMVAGDIAMTTPWQTIR